MKRKDRFYPLFLNIQGKKCVVVGGGKVALRKVMKLMEYGASIEVISTELCSELADLSGNGKIYTIRRSYRVSDLRKAWLAFAATDDRSTNKLIAEEAKSRGIPVNVADDAESSDFIVPSSVNRGEITIAVSTNGISPALSRKIRMRLEEAIVDEYSSLVNLVGEVRGEVKRLGIQASGKDWQEALDLDLMLELLRKGETSAVRAILLDNLKSGHN
jgi:siroheme synthase-like protein